MKIVENYGAPKRAAFSTDGLSAAAAAAGPATTKEPGQ